MVKKLATAFVVASAALGLSANAIAGPSLNGSSCGPGPNGFDCQIFEGDEDVGEWTEIQLPGDTSDGYLVLLETDNGNTDPSNWSDIAWWHDAQDANGATIQLLDFFSDPIDPALFNIVVSGYVPEDASGVTLWDVGNRYFFHSDADPVPEPGTIGLIGMALLSLFGFGIMRRRADA